MLTVAALVGILLWSTADAIRGFRQGAREGVRRPASWLSVALGLYAAYALATTARILPVSTVAIGGALGVAVGVLLHVLSRQGATRREGGT